MRKSSQKFKEDDRGRSQLWEDSYNFPLAEPDGPAGRDVMGTYRTQIPSPWESDESADIEMIR